MNKHILTCETHTGSAEFIFYICQYDVLQTSREPLQTANLQDCHEISKMLHEMNLFGVLRLTRLRLFILHHWAVSKKPPAAARVLMRPSKRDHISPVLVSLLWLPVKFRIEFKILLLTYKALNDRAPSCLKDLLV